MGDDMLNAPPDDGYCYPMWGSCALLKGHVGPHHGYPENIDAVVRHRLASGVLSDADTAAERQALSLLIEAYSREALDMGELKAAVLAGLDRIAEQVAIGEDETLGKWLYRSRLMILHREILPEVRAAVGDPGDVLDAYFRRRLTDLTMHDDRTRESLTRTIHHYFATEVNPAHDDQPNDPFIEGNCGCRDLADVALRALAATEAADHG